MSGHQVTPVPVEHSQWAWARLRRFLEPAIEQSGGRWRPEYVLAQIIMGNHTLWAVTTLAGVERGAFTTEIVNYPERTMLAIHFLGGEDYDDWHDVLLERMTEYGWDHGCDAIECNARKGFWKWFKRGGFKRKAVFYEKILEYGDE